jgi:hypothetical protein
MPDYKEMYLKLFRATEEAVNLLIDAQQACEELYITAPEPELKVVAIRSRTAKQKKTAQIDFYSPSRFLRPF